MSNTPFSLRVLGLGLVMLALALAGCQSTSPSQYIAPRVEGRVVDAQSHQPIAGVRVQRVTPDQNPNVDQTRPGDRALEQTPGVSSRKDGTFVLDSERDLELFRRTGWYSVTLSFTHSGYAPMTTNYSLVNATNTPTGEPLVRAGDILLAPLTR
jgi:hypothetical protein